MLASSLSCSSESRSSSSDDNLANHSPIHQLDGSPDHFEYFRMFEDASVTDVSGFNFSPPSSTNHQSQSFTNYETFEDLNMKFDLLNISRRQSPVREEHSPSVHGDVINESLEKDESDIAIPSQRTRSPSSQRDPSDLPLIPSILEELEIASETKKENYSGQQSPASEQWNLNVEDASSAIENKEEARDIEENRLLDQPLTVMISSYQCNDHLCTQLFYCQTCCKTICKECATQCVYKHVTVELAEFLDTAQRQAEEVLIEAYLGIDVLADDMENMGVS